MCLKKSRFRLFSITADNRDIDFDRLIETALVTWPLISGGHVTYFLETRSRYSTKMWHISVIDGGLSEKKSYFSPISMLGSSRVIFHVVTAITLLSVIQNIKQQILMQKLLRSSNMSCSKPFITLLKQQISNCCSGKNTRAMLWLLMHIVHTTTLDLCG